ncbi:unnamed protein product [Moneuplotes crassus]|uniref:Uncharacterized protein n=1 Tax=Euplotes crassus TaxID=5936 RepID=A0AAD1YA57_EUPCR|nr:unnamed protein product [Moneuplotes crassus]
MSDRLNARKLWLVKVAVYQDQLNTFFNSYLGLRIRRSRELRRSIAERRDNDNLVDPLIDSIANISLNTEDQDPPQEDEGDLCPKEDANILENSCNLSNEERQEVSSSNSAPIGRQKLMNDSSSSKLQEDSSSSKENPKEETKEEYQPCKKVRPGMHTIEELDGEESGQEQLSGGGDWHEEDKENRDHNRTQMICERLENEDFDIKINENKDELILTYRRLYRGFREDLSLLLDRLCEIKSRISTLRLNGNRTIVDKLLVFLTDDISFLGKYFLNKSSIVNISLHNWMISFDTFQRFLEFVAPLEVLSIHNCQFLLNFKYFNEIVLPASQEKVANKMISKIIVGKVTFGKRNSARTTPPKNIEYLCILLNFYLNFAKEEVILEDSKNYGFEEADIATRISESHKVTVKGTEDGVRCHFLSSI